MPTASHQQHGRQVGRRTRERAAGREFLGGLPSGLRLERAAGWYYLVKGDYELPVHTKDLVEMQWLIGQEVPGGQVVD